jgi:hypothetical protein
MGDGRTSIDTRNLLCDYQTCMRENKLQAAHSIHASICLHEHGHLIYTQHFDVISCCVAGNIYVCDYELHEIQIFRHDGAYLKSFGAEGTEVCASLLLLTSSHL